MGHWTLGVISEFVLKCPRTLRQFERDSGKVMLSASSDGMPSPVHVFEGPEGSYDYPRVLRPYDASHSRFRA